MHLPLCGGHEQVLQPVLGWPEVRTSFQLCVPENGVVTETRIFRACVGRNLAMLELQIIIASIMRRYDIVLEDPDFIVSSVATGLLPLD